MADNTDDIKILPCKKHGIKPIWVPPGEPRFYEGYWVNQVSTLICPQCDNEKQAKKLLPEIQVWNKKQK